MKKILYVLLALSSFVFQALAEQPKSLFVVGSTTFSKLIEATASEFQKETGIDILARPTGSSKGVIAIGEGVSDIGVISRYMTEQEIKRWPDIQQVTVGQDAIVFLVHKSNPINNLSSQQVLDVYTGNTKHWADLNAEMKGRIIPMSKNIGHGTLSSFQQFFGLISNPLTDKRHLVFRSTRENQLFGTTRVQVYSHVNQAVAYVSRHDGALAYESFGSYSVFNAESPSSTKVLSLDGFHPLDEGQFNAQYSFVRPLNLLLSSDSNELASQYVRFMLSDKGQKLIAEQRYIPLPENYVSLF